MGILSTYGELKAAVTDYYPRGGLAAFQSNLPTFVRKAHDEIMRKLRIPLLQASADLTINAERVAAPAGFRAVARLFLDNDPRNTLSPTSIENRMVEAAQYEAGTPRLFAIEGGDAGEMFAFAPIPAATHTGKLLYWRAIDFFATDAATNLILTRWPFLYLHGALAEAYRFDQFDAESAAQEALFRDLLASIDTESRADAMRGGVPMPSASGAVV